MTDPDPREAEEEPKESVEDRNHREIKGYIRVLLWVTVIMFIGGVISMIRSYQLEDAVDTLDTHTLNLTIETELAKDAAVEARDTLQAALDEFEARRQESEGSSPTAIRDALLAIARIEAHLCGGPCDSP